MANDYKELNMELLDKIAGGNKEEYFEYLREMTVKYGFDFDEDGIYKAIELMTDEELSESIRRLMHL